MLGASAIATCAWGDGAHRLVPFLATFFTAFFATGLAGLAASAGFFAGAGDLVILDLFFFIAVMVGSVNPATPDSKRP